MESLRQSSYLRYLSLARHQPESSSAIGVTITGSSTSRIKQYRRFEYISHQYGYGIRMLFFSTTQWWVETRYYFSFDKVLLPLLLVNIFAVNQWHAKVIGGISFELVKHCSAHSRARKHYWRLIDKWKARSIFSFLRYHSARYRILKPASNGMFFYHRLSS